MVFSLMPLQLDFFALGLNWRVTDAWQTQLPTHLHHLWCGPSQRGALHSHQDYGLGMHLDDLALTRKFIKLPVEG